MPQVWRSDSTARGKKYREKLERRESIRMSDCDHENWEIEMDTQWGCGHCHDCHKQISLAILFDNLRKRMEKSIESQVKDHEEQYHGDFD